MKSRKRPHPHYYYEPINGACIKREFPTAKKEHKCVRCGQPILPKTTYMREIWRDERQTHSLKFHLNRTCIDEDS